LGSTVLLHAHHRHLPGLRAPARERARLAQSDRVRRSEEAPDVILLRVDDLRLPGGESYEDLDNLRGLATLPIAWTNAR